MMAKIEVFTNYSKDVQRDVPELVKWFADYIAGRDIEEAVIVFRDAIDGLCFIAGSSSRDLSPRDIGWNLGQAQHALLGEEYDDFGE